MKILVTGANGYLGQGIVKELLDYGNEVIATDIKCNHVDYRAKIIECDIFDISDPFTYFLNPDVILHLAWRNGFKHDEDSHLIDLHKHYMFIKKMVAAGLKRVAVMGTMHEIGKFEGCINDDTPCNPSCLYGIAKNALRNAVKKVCEQYKATFQWLRGFYIVGNFLYGDSVFSKIAFAEKNKQISFPLTSGSNKYDFLDYKDFCKMVVFAISQDEISGVINICSGKSTAISERLQQFVSENNFSIKLDFGKYPERDYDSKDVWGDNTKIVNIMKKRRVL